MANLIWPIICFVLALLLAASIYLAIQLRKALSASLNREEKAYNELLDYPGANPNPVMRVNKMGVLLYANPSAAHFLAHWKININQKIPAELRDIIRQALLSGKSQGIEYAIEKNTFSVSIVPMGKEAVSIFAMDVSQRKKIERELERKSTTDEVTGLPNRIIFQQNLSLEVNHARPKQRKFGIYIVRLDDYFEIINTYGQKLADRFLQMFAGRLGDIATQINTIARISENEFGIIAPDCNDPSTMASIASNVIEQCTSGYKIGDTEIFTTISIGIAFYPIDGQDAEVLIRNAQLAVNRTSSSRNQMEFFQRGMVDQLQIKRSMVADLFKALEKKQFSLHYQPQIHLASHSMKSAEALIRWQHPEKGFISPYFFMTAAEETQLIIPIGEWVIRRACQQVVEWSKAGHSIKVGINLSAQQLYQPDIVEKVRYIIRETNAPVDQLEIELTETALARDIDRAIIIMKGFRDMGLTIALDDFGTGYSSLNYLMQFPVNKIKIDRSFIKVIDENAKQNQALIKGIIDLGHNLNLQVVAEGVETKVQLQFLQRHKCDYIQGYYFAQPEGPEKFATFFKYQWQK